MRRALRFLMLAAAMPAVNPLPLMACATCYGQSDAPMARGLTWAILALAGIIACVLSGVVVFFVHHLKKSSRLSEAGAASPDRSRERND